MLTKVVMKARGAGLWRTDDEEGGKCHLTGQVGIDLALGPTQGSAFGDP